MITGTQLGVEEMRCLELGYHAAWDEVRRKFVRWCFLEHGPEKIRASRVDDCRVVKVREPSAIPGYCRVGTGARRKRSSGNGDDSSDNNPMNLVFFKNGHLAVDPCE